MRYTLTFLEAAYEKLIKHLFSDTSLERAAYLLCGISRTDREIRFIVRQVLAVPDEVLLRQERERISIPSSSYVPVLGSASDTNHCFFLVHSHPENYPSFSIVDDEEELALFKTAYIRAENGIHGSVVFNSTHTLSGRVWIEESDQLVTEPISLIRILGKRYRFISTNNAPQEKTQIPEAFFDRQIRAFGKGLQQLLGKLHIGVVGCGATGSATIEQLARLGVGEITIIDHDRLDDTNISRVHGSTMKDFEKRLFKTDIMKTMVDEIGFGTRVHTITDKVIYESVAKRLRDCDIIFGCTDDHAGRAVLNRISIYYAIPVIDMGVKIDSNGGVIHNIPGRITIVKPGGPCMFCRETVDSHRIAAELMEPEQYENLRGLGYAPELKIKDPAVIPFTTAISSQSIIEMLNMISGFMGESSDMTELVYFFDSREFSNREDPKSSNCICVDYQKICRGDSREFLGMVWPNL